MWKWNANSKRLIFWNIKMINFDDYVNEHKTEHNKNWPYILDHLYRILIIGDSGSAKTNLLLNLENQPNLIKNICMLKILMKQNINIWLLKDRVLV